MLEVQVPTSFSIKSQILFFFHMCIKCSNENFYHSNALKWMYNFISFVWGQDDNFMFLVESKICFYSIAFALIAQMKSFVAQTNGIIYFLFVWGQGANYTFLVDSEFCFYSTALALTSQTKNFVAQMNGIIQFSFAQGQGANFTFSVQSPIFFLFYHIWINCSTENF